MDTGKTALIFFFGLFWASALGAITEYRAFDTAAWFRAPGRSKPIFRFIVAVLIANIAPLPLLWFFYGKDVVVPSGTSTPWAFVVAALASLSVFAIPRFLHAFLATPPFWKWFYDTETWEKVVVESNASQNDSFLAHFLSGAIYLIFFPALAWLLRWGFGG